MAVPKKRTSVSRKGKRRAGQHHKLYTRGVMNCPTSGEMTLAHHISPSGYYKGMKIFEVKTGDEEEEETEA